MPFDVFLPEALRRAEERADALEAKLKTNETARKKAEKDANAIVSILQRLKTTEDAFSDKEAQQVERENAIVERFETQNRRFKSKSCFHLPFAFACVSLSLVLTNSCFSPAGRMGEQYTLNQESDDHLLDALEILELNCDLARTNISSARAALKRIFTHCFPKDTHPEIFSQLTQHFPEK
jgi:NADH:ubiquinone oxidoreductase subunit B-like Fe-S oxidoreductase